MITTIHSDINGNLSVDTFHTHSTGQQTGTLQTVNIGNGISSSSTANGIAPVILYENSLPLNVNDYRTYSSTDSLGKVHRYYSYNNNTQLSLILLIFSIYLFYVATKLYHQYSDKERNESDFNFLFYLISGLILFGWTMLVLLCKGIPINYWYYELLYYPNQFVFGVVLSSLLLLCIGIFRFTIIAFTYQPDDDKNIKTAVRFSFVGFSFGLFGFIANILTIWSAFN